MEGSVGAVLGQLDCRVASPQLACQFKTGARGDESNSVVVNTVPCGYVVGGAKLRCREAMRLGQSEGADDLGQPLAVAACGVTQCRAFRDERVHDYWQQLERAGCAERLLRPLDRAAVFTVEEIGARQLGGEFGEAPIGFQSLELSERGV